MRGVGIRQAVHNPASTTLPLAKEFQNFLKSPHGKGISSNPPNFEVFLNGAHYLDSAVVGANGRLSY